MLDGPVFEARLLRRSHGAMRPTLRRFVSVRRRTMGCKLIFDTSIDTRRLKHRCWTTANLAAVNIVTFQVQSGTNSMA